MVVGAFPHLISRPQIVLLVPFDHKTTQIIRLESDLQAFCFQSCVPESELTVCEAASLRPTLDEGPGSNFLRTNLD
jgi:hypothetical protein